MRLSFILFSLFAFLISSGQEIPETTEQQIEMMADEILPGENELDQIPKEKILLNSASYEQLRTIPYLSQYQIQQFINYRKKLGALISIYELQAIPGWDVEIIRKIISWVEVDRDVDIATEFNKRFTAGQHNLTTRFHYARNELNQSPGIFIRYKYTHKDQMQFSLIADKDAGEKIFSSSIKGFDFYSGSLLLRSIGCIKTIIIGDYTVNLGQGLIHWQSLALKKSGDPMLVKRESVILRPYSSGGEFNFHRGAGVTINHHKISSTVFFSFRKLDATIKMDEFGSKYFTAFHESGYHRTTSEIESRRNLNQLMAGFNLKLDKRNFQFGLNTIYARYSLPMYKADEPFQLFAMNDNAWINASIDYSYTWKNLHLFGETAIDKRKTFASINGMLISLDKRLDFSLFFRHIPKDFQTLKGNAFTESSLPGNEMGMYAGIRFLFNNRWRLDAYADIFKFPWLRYQVSAPSDGKDYMFILSYQPGKQCKWYFRFRQSIKELKFVSQSVVNQPLKYSTRQDCRIHFNHQMDQYFNWQMRLDYSGFKIGQEAFVPGFLAYVEGRLSSRLLKNVELIGRWQIFEIRNYNSRIYTYENNFGVFSAPAYSGVGTYFFLMMKYKWAKKITIGIRYGKMKKNTEPIHILDDPEEKMEQLRIQIQYLF